VVVCQNTAKFDALIPGVLVHEFIHMFDRCVNKLDFTNLRHLACTEIRAANLTHCSYMSGWLEGSVPSFAVRGQHAICVKQKAYNAIRNVRRGVTDEEARQVIEDVFDK
jgi:inner membrane protease ATP23